MSALQIRIIGFNQTALSQRLKKILKDNQVDLTEQLEIPSSRYCGHSLKLIFNASADPKDIDRILLNHMASPNRKITKGGNVLDELAEEPEAFDYIICGLGLDPDSY